MDAEFIKNFTQACQTISQVVNEKAKEEVNPLFVRIHYILRELQDHIQSIHTLTNNPQQQRNHWSVLYRAGDTLDEMAVLIQNTTPVPIIMDTDYIKQQLVDLTKHVVHIFGRHESLYIITPKYQGLAKLWPIRDNITEG